MAVPYQIINDISDYEIEACERWAAVLAPSKARPRGFLDPKIHEHGYTLEEVGAVLGVTRERVRQIEQEALKKCRAWCKRNGYRLEDLLLVE